MNNQKWFSDHEDVKPDMSPRDRLSTIELVKALELQDAEQIITNRKSNGRCVVTGCELEVYCET